MVVQAGLQTLHLAKLQVETRPQGAGPLWTCHAVPPLLWVQLLLTCQWAEQAALQQQAAVVRVSCFRHQATACLVVQK